MQKVQRNSAISDVLEVQGLRRNRRKGRMPKFSFSHARKFQFPGRVPSPVAGAGLAGMILASCGPLGWWWQPSQHRLSLCWRSAPAPLLLTTFTANASQGASGVPWLASQVPAISVCHVHWRARSCRFIRLSSDARVRWRIWRRSHSPRSLRHVCGYALA